FVVVVVGNWCLYINSCLYFAQCIHTMCLFDSVIQSLQSSIFDVLFCKIFTVYNSVSNTVPVGASLRSHWLIIRLFSLLLQFRFPFCACACHPLSLSLTHFPWCARSNCGAKFEHGVLASFPIK